MRGWNHLTARHWLGQVLRNLADIVDPPPRRSFTIHGDGATSGTWTSSSGTDWRRTSP